MSKNENPQKIVNPVKGTLNEWNILGGTEMVCTTLISVREPVTYRCEIHVPGTVVNPNPKTEINFLPVDEVMVLKGHMSAEEKRGVSKYSFGTKTNCKVQKGKDKELEEDITSLICTDIMR